MTVAAEVTTMTDLTAFAWAMSTLLLVGGLAYTILEFRRDSGKPLKPARAKRVAARRDR